MTGPSPSQYSYSSTRVKAMESLLLSPSTMQSIIDASTIEAALTILFQQQGYKDYITKYGGVNIKKNRIDFALSRNLAESVNKLVIIAPAAQKNVVRYLVGKWDLYDVRLAIEAKERGQSFEQIAMHIIDGSVYNQAVIKEAMREQTVEGMMSRLMINSPYADIIKAASSAYAKNRNPTDAITALDIGYYSGLSRMIHQLASVSPQSALIVRKDIDAKNILSLIRAKRIGMKFQALENYLIGNGTIDKKELERIYEAGQTIDDIVKHVQKFDLNTSLEIYKKSGQLVSFEIGLNNSILNQAIKTLKPAILSFGTLLAYIYIKELEVRTLRIAINSKIYGLSQEELGRLIIWKK